MDINRNDPSSKPQPLTPLFPTPQVSDEAFNLFHSIDREIYARLAHTLGRDPAESVRVVAFWMWLEREFKDMCFIKRLLGLPLVPLLNDVADETALCLRCVESDVVLPFAGDEVLTLLPELLVTRGPAAVSLRLFHENRTAVVAAVGKIVNTVCARALGDLFRRAAEGGGAVAGAVYYGRPASVSVPLPAAGVEVPVAADDRTIFLTFSKGYPISEDEVMEFFTRRFGDFIEDLIMQEVGEDEQVLYARMVARSSAVIDAIVGGNKAKYIINGKHVWARKYVKKQYQLQQQPPLRWARQARHEGASSS